MDNLQWFKFAPSDWMMGKIMRCPEVTQSRFIRLCCLYWNKKCELSKEDAEIEIDEEHLYTLIQKKIIKINDGFIAIDFLDEQMVGIHQTSNKRREAANARWENRNPKALQNDASALQNDASALQNDADKIREDKIREDKSNSEKSKRFIPPTVQMVYSYCQERNNSINPQQFVDHYESNGWMVGKTKMKDWKAAVRTWEKNNFDNNSKSKKHEQLTEMGRSIREAYPGI